MKWIQYLQSEYAVLLPNVVNNVAFRECTCVDDLKVFEFSASLCRVLGISKNEYPTDILGFEEM